MARLQHRYQPPDSLTPDQDVLPIDSVCVILTRQSTRAQKERNTFSAEVDPKTLIAEARRLGFANQHIQVLDWDMGKGAYNTTIEDRPALRYWLTELLPSGKSRVVLVSQEDRLFRDRTEIQVNRFIEQVAQQRGWVICGSRVYNFRREMDKEHFRLACKYGKQYIEFHIKGRLHPACQRAAMEGRYTGGKVAWGYRVDYEAHSPTFKHLLRYEPHALLVIDRVFGLFAHMERPTVAELARRWWRDGLVWPFFTSDIDPRQVRWCDTKFQRDEARGGYHFVPRQAQTILTNPVYIGWIMRKGEVARDPITGEPRQCHEPLVDPDLFWWCYDHILPERPPFAPPRTARYLPPSHARRSFRQPEGQILFLGHGLVRCAQHDKRLSPAIYRDNTRGDRGQAYVRCWLLNAEERAQVQRDGSDCAHVPVAPIDEALCRSFADQLRLDDRDVEAVTRLLAQAAQRRDRGEATVIAELERQIEGHKAAFERAKQLAYTAPDLAADVVEDMRRAKRALADCEARLDEVKRSVIPSAHAWQIAERALSIAERIRETFAEWSRQAQARVLGLALETAVLGRVDQQHVGVWMRWQGGSESRWQIRQDKGHLRAWTVEEDAALRVHYHTLTTDALHRMLPGRTPEAIRHRVRALRLTRPRGGPFSALVPAVVASPPTPNEMARYGFPLAQTGAPEQASSGGLPSASCSANSPPRRSPGSASRHRRPRPSCAPCRSW